MRARNLRRCKIGQHEILDWMLLVLWHYFQQNVSFFYFFICLCIHNILQGVYKEYSTYLNHSSLDVANY